MTREEALNKLKSAPPLFKKDEAYLKKDTCNNPLHANHKRSDGACFVCENAKRRKRTHIE